jgi:predicted DNA-binding transcriptional regulator AlpA
VARELGLAPASITRYLGLQPLFPRPVMTIGHEVLWDQEDVQQYKASGPHEWPSRKRAERS